MNVRNRHLEMLRLLQQAINDPEQRLTVRDVGLRLTEVSDVIHREALSERYGFAPELLDPWPLGTDPEVLTRVAERIAPVLEDPED